MRRLTNHRVVLFTLLCFFLICTYDLALIKAEFSVSPIEWRYSHTQVTKLLLYQAEKNPQNHSDIFYLLPSWSNSAMEVLQFSNSIENIWSQNSEHLSNGRIYYRAGEYELAIAELKMVNNFMPTLNEEVFLLLGMAYQALGDEYLNEAEKYIKQAVDSEGGNTKARLQLAKFYYQQGKYAEAIVEFNRVVEKEPENGEAVKALGLSYFKANDLTKALRELYKAEVIEPNDLEILYTIGFVLHEKHLFAEAIQYYERVIALMPESTWAQEAKERILNITLMGKASTIEDLEEDIALLINSAPKPEDFLNLGIIILLDDIHYTLLPDDTVLNSSHKIFKILAERGKEAGEITMSYDSSYQTINIELARIINPDGTIIGIGSEDIQEVAPYANFPFYSNVKLLIISMPGLMVGSVVEYQVTIEDIPDSKRLTPREIDKGFVLLSTNPIKEARIEVSVPAYREFDISFVNGNPIEPEIILEGEMKNFVWRLHEIPDIIIQPMMPPLLDITPILNITSIPSWEIIADWWRELALEAMVSNDTIRSQVQQLTENLFTPEDKAAVLFNWVATQIRYVGLEYGKGDVKPRPASQVYDNKYGDCKDKSILLVTMLREVGIEAYPVGVSTLFNGQAWEEIPRIDALNHVITLCIINDERIWLDPTVETVSFGDIHGGILDRNVLVILDDGYEFIRIPIEAPEKNMEQEIMTVHIAEDSSAKVFSTITTKGINAIYRRAFFKALDPLYRKQNLEATVKGRTHGGMLLDYTVSDPEDLNHPHQVELVYTAPDYIQWEEDTGFIEASILSANKAGITDDIRLYPVFLGNTSVGDFTVHIHLPEDITIVSLPSSITLEIPQIIFTTEYTIEENTIIYHVRYEKRGLYIPLENYSAYKELQEQVDKELKKKIILQK